MTLTTNAVRRSNERATHIGTVASGIHCSGSDVKRRRAFATTTRIVIALNRPSCIRRRRVRALPKRRR
jgi:hypothetical protein